MSQESGQSASNRTELHEVIESTKKAPVTQTEVTDHLSIRPEGFGPPEVRFLFERRETRVGMGGAGVAYGAILLTYLLLVWLAPEPVREAILPLRLANLIWVPQEGPGGGGGGGNEQPEPLQPAELPPEEEEPTPVEPTPEPDVDPPEQLDIPARTLDANALVLPGALDPLQTSASRGVGLGTGGGAGRGAGLGPGADRGIGGGLFQPGNGVLTPVPLLEVKPQYTAEAMRAKVQGTVLLECVVLPDGTVGSIEIVRSLDATFGLDEEAVKAARQWRFRPGTRFGEPVAVLVTIELTFTLR